MLLRRLGWLAGGALTTVLGACSSSDGAAKAGAAGTGGTSSGGAATSSGAGHSGTGGSATGDRGGSAGADGGGLASSGGADTSGAANDAGANSGDAAGAGGASGATCSGDGAWNLVWSDEFGAAAGTAVDASKWAYDVGGDGWGNQELEYYTSGTNNAAQDGAGNLIISAKHETMGSNAYTSARIKTQGLATWTYGRVEARIKLPAGKGLWPAFWMLGDDITTTPWPACGEIDIVENIGKEPNIVHATIHGPGYSAGDGPTKQYSLPAPVASAFHVFAIEWEKNEIRWYVDDTLYSTKTKADIPASADWVYQHPFFIILNVAVGGGWPGSPDASTMFPQQMLVDYVRVCQR